MAMNACTIEFFEFTGLIPAYFHSSYWLTTVTTAFGMLTGWSLPPQFSNPMTQAYAPCF